MNWIFQFLFGLADVIARREAAAERKRQEEIEASDRAIREELAAAEARRKAAN
jgi:hypothetical protein